ncbi:MAG: hypothetical protein ACJAQZ_000834, partial [Planctomycetota bacterium]
RRELQSFAQQPANLATYENGPLNREARSLSRDCSLHYSSTMTRKFDVPVAIGNVGSASRTWA